MGYTPAGRTARVGAILFASVTLGSFLSFLPSWTVASLLDLWIREPMHFMILVVAGIAAWMAIRLRSRPLPAIGTLFFSLGALLGASAGLHMTWRAAQASRFPLRRIIWIQGIVAVLGAVLMLVGSLAPMYRRHIKNRTTTADWLKGRT